MAAAPERTVTLSEFKAHCLELIDMLHAGRLRRVHITKRGKPHLTVAAEAPPRPSEQLFGAMAGMVGVPAGLDLTAPVVDVADVEAMADWKLD